MIQRPVEGANGRTLSAGTEPAAPNAAAGCFFRSAAPHGIETTRHAPRPADCLTGIPRIFTAMSCVDRSTFTSTETALLSSRTTDSIAAVSRLTSDEKDTPVGARPPRPQVAPILPPRPLRSALRALC